MLRKDISRATENVTRAIGESGVLSMLENLAQSQKKAGSECLYAFSSYSRLYGQFGETEKQLISIMRIEFLHDPDFWTMVVTSGESREPSFYHKYGAVKFARENLPKLLSLLARESDQITDPKKDEEKPKGNGLSQISVTIIEEREKSSPERLVLALESIDGLYRACAKVLGESEGDLCVIACDSGSDKSFDFLGVAKVVDCAKQVILSLWDRIVYYREDKTERRLKLIAQTLPILDQVTSLKESKKLEPEQAELIKQQIIASVTKFADAGITIPEIENFTVYNPRQLMKPQPKLLVGPKQASPNEGKGEEASKEAGAVQIDDPEFKAYMEEMVKRFVDRKERPTDASSSEQEEGLDDEPNNAMGGCGI